MTHLLKKDTPFVFSKDCIDAFRTLKNRSLPQLLSLVVPDWTYPFELSVLYVISRIGAVLGQSKMKLFSLYILANRALTKAQIHTHHGKAKALPTNDARVVVKFLKSLFARFGTPRAIISDRGTHFCNDQFAKVMSKYGVTHRLSPSNERSSGGVQSRFKTYSRKDIGCTPYKLVYGKSCHLPIELEHKAYWALKHANFDLKTAGDHRKLQLNELNELRDQAYENSLIYKEKTKKLHDSKIKNRIFNVGDRVLLFNSRLKIFSGKLKTRWSGPFTITKVFPYGTVELSQPDGPNFKVNGHRVKHYFRGDLPPKEVQDLHTLPKDK
ncbi:reverse transcriptase domain-containing protein [Tanacetum coccineum]